VAALQDLVARHTEGILLGFSGEPRVNVLLLNLDLDARYPAPPLPPRQPALT
jgi:K+-transporting ATPase ATPase C chain